MSYGYLVLLAFLVLVVLYRARVGTALASAQIKTGGTRRRRWSKNNKLGCWLS